MVITVPLPYPMVSSPRLLLKYAPVIPNSVTGSEPGGRRWLSVCAGPEPLQQGEAVQPGAETGGMVWMVWWCVTLIWPLYGDMLVNHGKSVQGAGLNGVWSLKVVWSWVPLPKVFNIQTLRPIPTLQPWILGIHITGMLQVLRCSELAAFLLVKVSVNEPCCVPQHNRLNTHLAEFELSHLWHRHKGWLVKGNLLNHFNNSSHYTTVHRPLKLHTWWVPPMASYIIFQYTIQ